MMRKRLLLLTTIALTTSICAIPASAEEAGSTASYIDVVASSLELDSDSDGPLIAYRYNDKNNYVLIDTQGNVLSQEYGYINSNYSDVHGLYIVESDTGVHDEGCIDSSGNVVIPLEYADISVVSDRWMYGIKLVPSTEEDQDYTYTIYGRTENTKEYYRIDTVDFFFDREKVGTLNRSEFGNSTVTAYGAYIMVTNRAGYRVFYNNKMEKSPYQPEYSGEFDSSYKNGTTTYIHCGSGEKAFVPEFTVPLEDLGNPYVYDKAVLYDAHGNVVFNAMQNYDSIRSFKGGYAVVRMNSKSGLIDLTGKEVIPVVYDDLGYSEEEPLKYGCISAVKDGKFGFVDANGNVTCDFVYSNDIVRNRVTFGSVQNLDGTIIVLSGLAGELPEHYAEVDFQGYQGSYAFVATTTEGERGIVDIYGNTLVPFSSDYTQLDVNAEGTIAIAGFGNYQWRIYTLSHDEVQAVPDETQVPAVSEDGSWTCTNGHAGNTGKFCSECGEPRPEMPQEALTSCPNCNYEFPEGTNPKFCPECGTKLTEG